MFFGKKIKELEVRVDELEKRIHELAHSLYEQGKEIDQLYARMMAKEEKANKPRSKKKPRTIIDGKENTKATK